MRFFLACALVCLSCLSHAKHVDPVEVARASDMDYVNVQQMAQIMYAPRFYYTKSWGWVDIRHFGAAASLLEGSGPAYRSKTIFLYALLAGETHEQAAEESSRYDYEDLVSNFLGASFQYMYNNKRFKKLSYQAALRKFFKAIDVSENPEKDAPNFEKLAFQQEVKNRDYFPLFTTKSSLQWSFIQIELNELRLEATAFLTSNMLLREEALKKAQENPAFKEKLAKLEESLRN